MTLKQYVEELKREKEKKYSVTELLGALTSYEKEIADLRKIVERLDAENNELKDTKADLEEDNRHLAERVKMLEHKRDELIDELKRVGNCGERDFMAGQLIAYRQALRMILNRGKE